MKMGIRVLAAVCILFAFAAQAVYAVEYPDPIGRVSDFAGLLTPDEVGSFEAKLSDYEARTGNEIAVVTIESSEGLGAETYAMNIGNLWGVGKKEKYNGVVLLVVVAEREVAIEPASGLENILTNSVSEEILDEDVLPKFKDGRMSEGISNGVLGIIDRSNL